MYLMDEIANTAHLVETRLQRGSLGSLQSVLNIYPAIRDKLVGTPRFLFDSASTRTVVELSLGRPKIILEALQHLRIPYPRMWIEWNDHDRQKLRDKFAEKMEFAELRPFPQRLGFLLESDDGRRGHATWAWSISADSFPNIGAVEPFFDLDNPIRLPLNSERVKAILKGNLGSVWKDNPIQLRALISIWETADHKPSEWGEQYLRSVDPLYRTLAYADTVGEYIGIWTALLLLTASRPTLKLTPITLDRLNKARSRRKQILLLEYTQVTMNLNSPSYSPIVRGPLGYSRKSPRVHLVSSYLARRGDKHWVVQPYMRGKGETIHRRTFVKG